MEFLIGVVVAGLIGWMLTRLSSKRDQEEILRPPIDEPSAPPPPRKQAPKLYDSMQELPAELRDVVLRIMQTPWDHHNAELQRLREQLTDTEYHLRNKHGLRWNGEDCGPLPIRSLTHHQRRVLSYAAALHAIQIEGQCVIEPNRNVFVGLNRTIQGLTKHGMLRLDEHGVYRITQKGLQALETLSMRFD